MFDTVLIANRGEIARRVIRTLRTLGIESVAVYSEGDAGAAHVREADRAVHIGPDPASESYLRVQAIIQAALTSGAQAIHPGYGFLAESAALAQACADNGVVFIGPGTRALEIMGDKVRAREHLAGAGVPEVPGFADLENGATLSDQAIVSRAETLGYPLLVKPSAGGGGKGMEVVHSAHGLPEALASARRVARSAFGDDTLLIERLIERPRHIEVQVFGTSAGSMIALGVRECTLQRRHQKVVEEAPHAGGISDETVLALETAAMRAAESVDYVGAGTVEFLVDADHPDEFFFIEMNTRLQVEHPVTELVHGIDLVELQVRTAAGADVLGRVRQATPTTQLWDGAWRTEPSGHAIEARLYAESPERGFIPSAGTVLALHYPAHARIDGAVERGDEISQNYDPMIAKIITHGVDRAEALARLQRALAGTVILGVDTNLRFLRTLLDTDKVRAGDLDTGLIGRMPALQPADPPPQVLAQVAACINTFAGHTSIAHASPLWAEGAVHSHTLRGVEDPLTQLVDADGVIWEVARGGAFESAPDLTVASDDSGDAPAVWVAFDGATWRFSKLTRRERTLRLVGSAGRAGPEASLESPMTGTVTRVHVDDGSRVTAGQPLISIEAMKMEHPVVAPYPGVVRLHAGLGDLVRRGQELASVTPSEESESP